MSETNTAPRVPLIATSSSWFRQTLGSSTVVALLGLATVIIRNELDRLISEVLSSAGHTYALSNVTGPAALSNSGAWAAWDSSTGAGLAHAFIAASLLVDVLFVGCLTVLGLRLIRYCTSSWNAWTGPAKKAANHLPVSFRKAAAIVLTLAVVDLLADVVGLVLDSLPARLLGVWPGVLVGLTYAKLAVALVLALQLLLSRVIGNKIVVPFLGKAVRAVYAQRLVAIVVLAVGALSLLPIDNLFEQIPDVYRGWIHYPLNGGWLPFTTPTAWTMVFDFIAFAITGIALFALGRQRARHYASLTKVDERKPAPYWPWFTVAGGIVLVAIVLGIASRGASVDVMIVGVFVVAVVVFPISSWIIRRVLRGRPAAKPFLATNLKTRATQVRLAGDLFVAAWIAIWVLGPFKALVSPLFLAATNQFAHTAYAASAGLLIAFEIVLLLLGVGAPMVFRLLVGWRLRLAAARDAAGEEKPDPVAGIRKLVRTVESTDPNPDDSAAGWVTGLAVLALAVSVFGVLAVLILPTYVAVLLGPVGTLVTLLGCWATIIGMIIVASGKRKPFELFQVLRLRSTPIVTLLIVVPLAISFIDVPPTLHAVRTAAGRPALPARATVASAFTHWANAQSPCVTELPNGEYVEPLLLFAAEGGGIRAATWTVDVMDKIAGDGGRSGQPARCSSGATLLSTGASGGSIGLASFRESGNATKDASEMSTAAFAGPNALAGVVAGLLDGDLLGGLTGIRVATPTNFSKPIGQWVWHDRTALQELAWQAEIPQFSKPYDVTRESPTGYLVLNSEDAVTRCKVLVSQLNLRTRKGPPGSSSGCAGSGNTISNTIDLESYIGAKCMADLNWSTAAELSARFPVVSPPGRIDATTLGKNCLTKAQKQNFQGMQLIDGGTADNSGLGTISDIAPQLVAQISRFNGTASGSSTSPYVVPIVVYASNDPGLDLSSTPYKTTPDALVPIGVLSHSEEALVTPSAWLTRDSSELAPICAAAQSHGKAAGDRCTAASNGIRALIPRGVVVVSPSTSPAVSIPLGWSLSGFSSARLGQEADTQARCGVPSAPPSCRADDGYGELGALLSLFR